MRAFSLILIVVAWSSRTADLCPWREAEGAWWGRRTREGLQRHCGYHSKGEGQSCWGRREEGAVYWESPIGGGEEADWGGGQAAERAKLKLAEAKNLNLAQADEIADLKMTLDACEEKWYNEGFADTENSAEPIVHQARHHGFREGWLTAL